MNAIHEQVVSSTLKVLSARKAEIDSTVRAIETNPRSAPAAASPGKHVYEQIRATLQHLYESKDLVDAAIAHLERLAEIRQ